MKNLLMSCAVTALTTLSARPVAKSQEVNFPPQAVTQETRSEFGVASWYGEECQGNETASGEVFDMNGLTSAHRDYPLGTRVRVTNLRNNRSLILLINDRGPGIAGRVIDVSKAAAIRLGFLRAGLTPVKIEIVSFPKRYSARDGKQQSQAQFLD